MRAVVSDVPWSVHLLDITTSSNNGRTSRDTFWDVDSGGPKEP